MAKSTIFVPSSLIKHNHYLTLNSPRRTTKSSASAVRIRAAAQDDNGSHRRLIDVIRLIPKSSKEYLNKPSRRVLFGGISLLGGFYVAQTVSLSFGALGVNDVISAVLCVLATEYATKFYYSRTKASFFAVMLNVFKLGFTYGLFLDAFKLAS